MSNVSSADVNQELIISDPQDHVEVTLSLAEPAAVKSGSPDQFPIPIDKSWALETSALSLNFRPSITVREPNGTLVRVINEADRRPVTVAPTILEMPGPMNLYFCTDSELIVDTSDPVTSFEFPSPASVSVGALFNRKCPTDTISVTHDPFDIFAAISTFGSAIPTVGPERSRPAVRGHPPLLHFGDSLDIPAALQPPDTGVAIHLPATYRNAILATPLAYYLGGSLVPDTNSHIAINGAEVLDLDEQTDIGAACSAVLDRVLLLDCLCRQTWVGSIDLDIAEDVPDVLDADWKALAEAPYHERLRAYFRVPESLLSPVMPRWRPAVPTVVNDATIACTPHIAYRLLDPSITPLTELSRSETRRLSTASKPVLPLPIGVNQAFPAAFENWITHRSIGDKLRVVLVCMSDAMHEEFAAARSIYAEADRFPLSIHQYQSLTTDELAAVIEEGADFFHFMGHIEPLGFRCSDGHLPVASLTQAPIEVFFLNACDSMASGISLIERGAVSGISTIKDIKNRDAIPVGKTIASLLFEGFPIGAALKLAQTHHAVAKHYQVIGDPTIALSKLTSIVPHYLSLEERSNGKYDVTIHSCLTMHRRQGSVSSFRIDDPTTCHLAPIERTFSLSQSALNEFLGFRHLPLLVNGSLEWSTSFRQSL